MPLLSFDEATRRLHAASRSYLGVREIPVVRIVGSVDRTDDFDRQFRAQRRLSLNRLASLRRAAMEGALPAIDVFEVGGAYFVQDGHHRVALARELGREFIDAAVVRLDTDYEVPPDVDVSRLLHTDQQRRLLDETGLSAARPEAAISFTLLDGYAQLREAIEAYGYALSVRRGGLVAPAEVAAAWYDEEYLPALAAIRAAGLPEQYASWHSTEADQVLWIHQLRRELRSYDDTIGYPEVARQATHLHLGLARKHRHLRDGSEPLARHRQP